MDATNKRRYKFLIKRVRKEIVKETSDRETRQEKQETKAINMWGLFAMEEIPIGAFILEYVGEMVTKK